MPEITTAGIIRKGSLFLLAKRLPGGSMGGRWEFPGGKAERGESPEEALKREILEEFEVSIRVGPHLVSTSFSHNDKQYRLLAFEVFLEEENLSLREHEEVRWLSFPEIASLNLADSDRRIFELLRGQMTVSG